MEGNYLDKILLRKAAIQSVALMLGVIMLSYAVKQYNAVITSASYAHEKVHNKADLHIEDHDYQQELKPVIPDKDEEIHTNEEGRFIFTGIRNDLSNDIMEKLSEQYLVIRKPKGESLQMKLEDLYITRQLKLLISGFTDETPDNSFIGRVQGEDVFIGEPKYSEIENIEQKADGTYTTTIIKDYGNDPVNAISITSSSDEFGKSVHEVVLQLNHVYVHILYEDENYYYIDLKKPKEVYDKILVIDAGHGGKDPGALSKDGKIYEKEINLKILHELKELLDKEKIKVYYTRTIDQTIYLRPRVSLANEVDCDFFISIHCNANNYTGSNGTEVLYYNHENKNIKTKDLAKILNEEISKTVSLKNTGLIQMKDDDIFILANAVVPAVIIEAGYMTNLNDLKYLQSREGQQNIAQGIYNGILRAYEELKP